LTASRLRVDDASIEAAHTFDELRLGPLDLVLVVLRLERFDRGQGDFLLEALGHARTVGDLVLLVDLWLQHDTISGSIEGAAPQRRSLA
jgi:hypothetical protein